MTQHLVGIAEIGQMFAVSRQRAGQLAAKPDFPKPTAKLAAGPVWERKAVEEWAERAGRTVQRDDG